MLTSFNMIIFLKIYLMISNFQLFPYLNISQNFVQNVQKQKKHLCPELETPSKLSPVNLG